MEFRPSPYGAAATSTSSSANPDYVEYAKQLAPLVAPFVNASKDVRETAEVVAAKISNYEKMKNVSPYNVIPGTLWYENEITKLKARLTSLKTQASEAQASATATATWRNLGQTAVGVGILTGIALLGLVVVTTLKVARKNPSRRTRRRRSP